MPLYFNHVWLTMASGDLKGREDVLQSDQSKTVCISFVALVEADQSSTTSYQLH